MEVAVYLFTGFLEAGKTTLVEDTLADERFHNGEKTLVLACEEGEEEYDLPALEKKNIFVECIDSQTRLNADKLSALQKKYNALRVMIEYNGMWMNEDLYNAMPDGWYIYQEIMLADSKTFANYNANMRSLTVNKLQNCELVVFNRFTGGEEEKTALHKIVRGVSRSVAIAYEHPDRTVEYDEIEDPLPYDLSADVVEIADRDYAIFYRDMSEDMEKYNGKTLRFKGIVAKDPKLPATSYVIGRHVMTCCVNDIAYRGMICDTDSMKFASGDWVVLTAKLRIGKHKLYNGMGPLLTEIKCEGVLALPEDEQVATFY